MKTTDFEIINTGHKNEIGCTNLLGMTSLYGIGSGTFPIAPNFSYWSKSWNSFIKPSHFFRVLYSLLNLFFSDVSSFALGLAGFISRSSYWSFFLGKFGNQKRWADFSTRLGNFLNSVPLIGVMTTIMGKLYDPREGRCDPRN